MQADIKATITSKGQITLPADIRRLWNLKAGDQISFGSMQAKEAIIRPEIRKSIFDNLDELRLPSRGKPLTQADIDDAITDAMDEKYGSKKLEPKL
jgi:antitoxin PrlF